MKLFDDLRCRALHGQNMEQIIDCIQQYIAEANGLTPEVKRQLSILRDFAKHLQTIYGTIREEDDDLRKTLEKLHKLVLQGDYLMARCKTAALSQAACKMKQQESSLPERIQPKVKEIISYFESIEEQTEKIDKWLNKIATKVSGIFIPM